MSFSRHFHPNLIYRTLTTSTVQFSLGHNKGSQSVKPFGYQYRLVTTPVGCYGYFPYLIVSSAARNFFLMIKSLARLLYFQLPGLVFAWSLLQLISFTVEVQVTFCLSGVTWFFISICFSFSTGFWVTIKSRNFWMALSLDCHHWNECKFSLCHFYSLFICYIFYFRTYNLIHC